MKVSLNTIKQYTDINLTVDELAEKINRQLGGIEAIVDIGDIYKDALIVRVVSAIPHPNADRLRVTMIDDGGVREGVERDENGYVQVVCGAPNVREGILAVWLPPQSTVPSTAGDNAPFVLDSRELRGVMSHGMLAAADELAIGSDHDGILEINPDEWRPRQYEIKPGASFAQAFGLDGVVIDIENKMFTHRPDLFGQLGVAREIAGIQHLKFTSPDWYWKLPQFGQGDSLSLNVTNDAVEKVPRFMTVVLKGVRVGPSPLWLQCALVAMGAKPINNIVDATNYIMHLTAQPVHAYDYDKLRGGALGVRLANAGEKLQLLNHKTYELNQDDIVIVDGEGPVGLAGIMGGGESEVSEATTNVVLEVATFDMYSLRKTSMRHGVFTDALTRFNKGQSPLQNDRVLQLLVTSIIDVAGGAIASPVSDVCAVANEVRDSQSLSGTLQIELEFINRRLGLSLSSEDVCELLRNVEFAAYEADDGRLNVTAPFWRTDIELPEDIVEEVGRLYGFDRLPQELPVRSVHPVAKNSTRELQRAVRSALARVGANEVLNYSFVPERLMRSAAQDPAQAYRLSNALSPDLQYYRLSLTPSLLSKVHMNQRAGYEEFSLYEMGKVHCKSAVDKTEPDVPAERSRLALVLAYGDKVRPEGAAFYHARSYLVRIVELASLELRPLADISGIDEAATQMVAPYEPSRAAVILRDDTAVGVIGEFKQSVKKALKLPEFSAGFEIAQDALSSGLTTYRPLSRYPSTDRDITLRVDDRVPYRDVEAAVRSAVGGSDLDVVLAPVSIYQAEGDAHKNVTLRLTLTDTAKTITTEDANALVGNIIAHAAEVCGAEAI